MRRLLTFLILSPVCGCISIKDFPGRDVVVDLKDSENKPIPEWWVLSWQETQKCNFGLVLVGKEGVMMDPRTVAVENVRLVHMTSEKNQMFWTGSYDYFLWYLVFFPPGGAWQGWTWFRPDCGAGPAGAVGIPRGRPLSLGNLFGLRRNVANRGEEQRRRQRPFFEPPGKRPVGPVGCGRAPR